MESEKWKVKNGNENENENENEKWKSWHVLEDEFFKIDFGDVGKPNINSEV